jgi:hypothetical protein
MYFKRQEQGIMVAPSGNGRTDWFPEEVFVTKPSEVLFPGADDQFKEDEIRSLGGLPVPVCFASPLEEDDEDDFDFMYDDEDDLDEDLDDELDEDIDEDLDEEFDEDLDEDEEDDLEFEDEDEDM